MSRPKRNRQHELETESQRAFASALPGWVVVREASDDYGVDREVEVFENGEATGLTFKVQLKGTDKSGESRRIKRSALNYWRDLDVPVLLVSYEASTSRLRSRWVHSIGADGPDSGAETLTVHMNQVGDIDTLWVDRLADDLRLLRQLKKGVVPNPVPVRVNVDRSVADQPLSGIVAEMLQVSRRGARPLRRADDAEAAIEFEVRDDLIRVSLPLQWATVTLRTPVAVADLQEARELARDLLLLAGAALVKVNPDASRDFARTAGPRAHLWRSYALATRLGPLLSERGSADLLLAVIHEVGLADDEQSKACADLYVMTLHEVINDVGESQFNTWAEEQEQRAQAEADAGRLHFNLASLTGARGDDANAKRLFAKAAELDSRYEDDEVWLHLIAGCTWRLGEFENSAQYYERAIAAGADPQECLPLMSDSLLFAGQYKKARTVLAPWEPVGIERDRVGIIRQRVLEHLYQVVGIDSQQRVAPTKEQLEALEVVDNPEEKVIELMRQTDALDVILWDRMTAPIDPEASFDHALVAAVSLVNNPGAWIGALTTAQVHGELGARDAAVVALDGTRKSPTRRTSCPPNQGA